jgi:hypothetical protein
MLLGVATAAVSTAAPVPVGLGGPRAAAPELQATPAAPAPAAFGRGTRA